MRLVTASEMASLDRRTIEEIGIPGMVLMENAARGAAGFFLEFLPDILTRRITVLAGSGNNAGDGFVLARIFHGMGAKTGVVCLRDPERLQGDALTNFRIMGRIGVPVQVWSEAQEFEAQWRAIAESEVVIDAILGTGLKSEVQGLYRQVIDRLNDLDVPILAVDVPSGLDASTGKILGNAVRASATATFGCLKIGQVIDPGRERVGELRLVDIGIPPQVVEKSGVQRWWLDGSLVSGWLHPRPEDAHKGTCGHIAVLSGSRGKTGAATLICQGAARVGAGLVTLFIPESLNSILEVKLTEAMTWPIPETEEQSPSIAALDPILELLAGKQAFAMGPGISTHASTGRLVRGLLAQCPCPMVLDADALTLASDDVSVLGSAGHPIVITPHPGEMARLLSSTTKSVQEDRLGTASRFSQEHGITVVLKGSRTIIAAPDGRIAVNGSGNPAMASGGMGDTLTGMIAGLLAQGCEPFRAACLGVYIHGAAADRRIGHIASRGLLASDLLEEIPGIIGEIERA